VPVVQSASAPALAMAKVEGSSPFIRFLGRLASRTGCLGRRVPT
jgi:hypothetical protein